MICYEILFFLFTFNHLLGSSNILVLKILGYLNPRILLFFDLQVIAFNN